MAKPTVLVTGCNGFLASYLVIELLAAGYKVRGTVRSLEQKGKYAHLIDLLPTIPNAKSEDLEFFEADLLQDGAFDKCVTGCVGVFHTASPFFFPSATTDIQKELIDPALKGTRNVLTSCANARETVKRVIVTSSTASVVHAGSHEHSKVYTEEDWNETSNISNNAYAYSKTLAEREAWKLQAEFEAQYGKGNVFDLCTINPVLITGPVITVARVKQYGLSELNTSCKTVRSFLVGKQKVATSRGFPLVDVRDVVRAHRLAFEVPEASGKRFICTAGIGHWCKLCVSLANAFPELKSQIPDEFEGDVEQGYDTILKTTSAQLQSVLTGFGAFITPEQSVIDCAKSLIDNDLLNIK